MHPSSSPPMYPCTRCRALNSAHHRFCLTCGAPLASPTVPLPTSERLWQWFLRLPIILQLCCLLFLYWIIIPLGIWRAPWRKGFKYTVAATFGVLFLVVRVALNAAPPPERIPQNRFVGSGAVQGEIMVPVVTSLPSLTPDVTPNTMVLATATVPLEASTATLEVVSTLEPPPPPEPTADPLARKIEAHLVDVFDEPVAVATTGDSITLTFLLPRTTFLSEELHGLELLHWLESTHSLALYSVLRDFDTVMVVTTRIHLADVLTYEVTATRDQAYAFPSDYLDFDAQPSAMILAASAASARMYTKFTVDMLADDLKQVVAAPGETEVRKEFEQWVSGVDLVGIEQDATSMALTLDLSDMVAELFDPDERGNAFTQEWVLREARLDAVAIIGGFLDRFARLEAVQVRVLVDQDTVVSVRCNRSQFQAIGSEAFVLASTLEASTAILSQCELVK